LKKMTVPYPDDFWSWLKKNKWIAWIIAIIIVVAFAIGFRNDIKDFIADVFEATETTTISLATKETTTEKPKPVYISPGKCDISFVLNQMLLKGYEEYFIESITVLFDDALAPQIKESLRTDSVVATASFSPMLVGFSGGESSYEYIDEEGTKHSIFLEVINRNPSSNTFEIYNEDISIKHLQKFGRYEVTISLRPWEDTVSIASEAESIYGFAATRWDSPALNSFRVVIRDRHTGSEIAEISLGDLFSWRWESED